MNDCPFEKEWARHPKAVYICNQSMNTNKASKSAGSAFSSNDSETVIAPDVGKSGVTPAKPGTFGKAMPMNRLRMVFASACAAAYSKSKANVKSRELRRY